MHEIITLQFGEEANHIGTHFWNTQETYFSFDEGQRSPVDSLVHFRPGLGVGRVKTFTPRVLIYDLKGGFGSMRLLNALYSEDDASETNGHEVIQEPKVQQISYQQGLESGIAKELKGQDIRFWSDFNKIFYHPRSTIQLNEFSLNSTITPFNEYEQGSELFNSYRTDLVDRDVRKFAEECDQIQGFQIFSQSHGPWAGFSSSYIEELQGEYGKTEIWTWCSEIDPNTSSRREREKRCLEFAKSIISNVELSSLYLPLKSPISYPAYLAIDRTSKWQVSGLLSLAMETATLPTRLKDEKLLMAAVSEILKETSARKIASLKVSFPKFGTREIDLALGESADHKFTNFSCLRSPTPQSLGQLEPSYVTPLQYPLIDTFPPIFTSQEKEIDVFSSISTDSGQINRIKDTQKVVAQMLRGEERSELIEALQAISEQLMGPNDYDYENDESDN